MRILAAASLALVLAACGEQPKMTYVEFRPLTARAGSHVVSRAYANCGGKSWSYKEKDVLARRLPDGLVLQSGELTGIPSHPGEWDFHVTFKGVRCQGQDFKDLDTEVKFIVEPAAPVPTSTEGR